MEDTITPITEVLDPSLSLIPNPPVHMRNSITFAMIPLLAYTALEL